MDRINFVNSIKCKEDIETTLKDYFDEIMAMYNIVNGNNYISISTNINNSSIAFSLEFNSEKDATTLKDIIAAQNISIYSHRYYTNIVQNKNTLNINLLEIQDIPG